MATIEATNYFCKDILNEKITNMKPYPIGLGKADLYTLIGYSHFRKLEGKAVV